MKLAKIYDEAGFPELAARIGTCATWLQFNVLGKRRTLRAANFCQVRLCPMCTARKAKRAAYKLTQVMDRVEEEHKCRFLFLTLTVRNCEGPDLGQTIGQLTQGWYRLMDQKAIERALGGWFRAIEITRNPKNGTYHPHIHAILAVPCEYFDKKAGLWITQKSWRERWAQALRVDYDPSVRISLAYNSGGGTDAPCRSAAVEAAKYTTKDSEYIDPRLSIQQAAGIVRDYTVALHRRRLTAYGGWLKAAAKLLDAEDLDDGDLVRVDGNYIRDDLALFVETYNWRLGAGDYILADRQINPLLIVRHETGELVPRDDYSYGSKGDD